MSVTGSAGITLNNQSNHDAGNSFSSGDSLNFSGSGELDNGLVIPQTRNWWWYFR